MANVKAIPEGMSTVTPTLMIRDCAGAIEFYKRALDAEALDVFTMPGGTAVWHARLRIGDSNVFVSEEMPQAHAQAPSRERPSPAGLWLCVRDCDASYRRAIDAGAKPVMEPADQFWGDRLGSVIDPYGYHWAFATRVKNLTAEEMRRAGEEFAKKMAGGGG